MQNYGTLDAGDFFPGDLTSAVIRWCSSAELSTVFEEAGDEKCCPKHSWFIPLAASPAIQSPQIAMASQTWSASEQSS